jgi:ketosteroid isomerase-like protein
MSFALSSLPLGAAVWRQSRVSGTRISSGARLRAPSTTSASCEARAPSGGTTKTGSTRSISCRWRWWRSSRRRGNRSSSSFAILDAAGEAWDDLQVTAEQFIDAGDRVFVAAHFRGRGRASGITVETRLYEVYTLRDHKVVRVDEFTQRDEAIKALGLRE